jgi:flavodoxin
MKAMVVYDSQHGNTGKVAKAVGQAIGESLGSPEQVEVVQVGSVSAVKLAGLELLVVGSPTQRLTATPATTDFLKGIPDRGLEGLKVAAFDTRFTEEYIHNIKVLPFFVRLFGYAAEPIAKRLEKKGGELAVPPEAFYVADTEGPLLDGELDRAAAWAEKIVAAL